MVSCERVMDWELFVITQMIVVGVFVPLSVWWYQEFVSPLWSKHRM